MLLVSQTGWLQSPHWGCSLVCVDSCSVPNNCLEECFGWGQNHVPNPSPSNDDWVLDHRIIPWHCSIYREGCKFAYTTVPLKIPGQLYTVKYRSCEMCVFCAKTAQQALCGFSPFSSPVSLGCLSGCTKGSHHSYMTHKSGFNQSGHKSQRLKKSVSWWESGEGRIC